MELGCSKRWLGAHWGGGWLAWLEMVVVVVEMMVGMWLVGLWWWGNTKFGWELNLMLLWGGWMGGLRWWRWLGHWNR